MGWSFACAIAQGTMELLLGPAMRGAAVAWIDDGLLPGVDAASADADAAVFRARCRRVNARVAEEKSHAARPVVEAFGFVWNFPGDHYTLPVEWRAKAAALLRATCSVGGGAAKVLWRCVGVGLWAAVGLRVRLHAVAELIAWVSATAKALTHADRGWATVVALSPAAAADLLWIARELLDAEVRVGPPPAVPGVCGAAVFTDASPVAWGVVITSGGGWWGAYGLWDPALAGETIYFLELRAALSGLQLAADRLGLFGVPLLLRVDNLPAVQAMVRGCSTTRLGSRLVARIDAAVRRLGGAVAVDWVSTDFQLADPLSRVPLGASPPPGTGAPGDLTCIAPPLDPMGRSPPADVLVPGATAKQVFIIPLLAASPASAAPRRDVRVRGEPIHRERVRRQPARRHQVLQEEFTFGALSVVCWEQWGSSVDAAPPRCSTATARRRTQRKGTLRPQRPARRRLRDPPLARHCRRERTPDWMLAASPVTVSADFGADRAAMSGWAALRAEWRSAAETLTYTLTLPAPWRQEGARLFREEAPLDTPQLQGLNNVKVAKRTMLAYGEAVAAAVPIDADVEEALRSFLAYLLLLQAEQVAVLATASVSQVCGLLAAVFEHPSVADAKLLPVRDAVAAWRRERRLSTSAARGVSPAPRPPPPAGDAARIDDVLRAVTQLSGDLRELRASTADRLARLETDAGAAPPRRVAVAAPQPSGTPSVAGDGEGGGGDGTADDDATAWGSDGGHPYRWDPGASGTDSDATDDEVDLDDLDAVCTHPCAHRLVCDAETRGLTEAPLDHRELYSRQRARFGRLPGERRSRGLDMVELQALLHTPGKSAEQVLRRAQRVVGDRLAEIEWGRDFGDALREPRRLSRRHAAAWQRLRLREAASAALPRSLRGRGDLAALDAARDAAEERRDPLRADSE
eukprot:gene7530-23544_t